MYIVYIDDNKTRRFRSIRVARIFAYYAIIRNAKIRITIRDENENDDDDEIIDIFTRVRFFDR